MDNSEKKVTLSKKINTKALAYMSWLKVLVFLLCLIPLAVLIVNGLTNQLGANPVEKITRMTGKWTLIFLCMTLAVTPARKLFNLPFLIRLRRMLGLFSFFYVFLHFMTWVWFDQFFDIQSMIKDVYKRPFITVGFIAFVLLIPLALTSSNRAIKTLGGKNWQRLHQLIYPIILLGILHYYWMRASKHNLANVEIYAVIIAVLLIYRVVVWSMNRRQLS